MHIFDFPDPFTPLSKSIILQKVATRIISPLAFLAFVSITCGAGPYRFDIIARPGEAGVMGLHTQVSINDSNRVAFVAQETSDYTYYTSVWVGDGNGTPPRHVTFGQGNLNVEYPQINNSNLVVGRQRFSGSPLHFYVRIWNADTGDGGTVDSTRCSGFFCTAVNLPRISNDGYVSYLELDPTVTPTVTNMKLYNSTITTDVASFQQGLTLRPAVANGGKFVARAGDNSTDPIILYNEAGPVSQIASSPSYSALGSTPGISDDGSIIAFYGQNADGPGLFASITNGTGRVIQKIVGVADGVTDLWPDTRIGVTVPRGNPKWVAILYAGSKQGTAGIYKSVLTFPKTPSSSFIVDPPLPVVVTEQKIFEDTNNDGLWQPTERALTGVVQDFDLWDPINNDGDIAFWVQTTTGDEGIVRTRCQLAFVGFKQSAGEVAPLDPAVPQFFGPENAESGSCASSTGRDKTRCHGCALCSCSSMLTSFGLAMTPSQLDELLLDPAVDGYDENAKLLFERIPTAVPIGVQCLEFSTRSITRADLDEYLIREFCNRESRVLLRLNHSHGTSVGPHYVFVTGRVTNDWKIWEPGFRPASVIPGNPTEDVLTSLYAHEQGFVANGQTHTFSVAGVRSFRLVKSCSALSVTAHSPIELTLIDPTGRRLGYDAGTQSDIFEIPEASYFRDFPLIDDESNGINIGDPSGTKNLYVPSPLPGNYQFLTTGTGAGNYSVDVQTVGFAGKASTYHLSGVTGVGVVSNYNIVATVLPTAASITQTGSNMWSVSFGTQESVNYTAEFKTSLSQSNWTALQSMIGNGKTLSVIDTNATGTARFYRIRASL